jgi:hypothetical protein
VTYCLLNCFNFEEECIIAVETEALGVDTYELSAASSISEISLTGGPLNGNCMTVVAISRVFFGTCLTSAISLTL